MAENRPQTIMRGDDLRLRKGRRLLFGPNDTEALRCARVMLRLTPEHQRYVRMLAESFLHEQMLQDVEAMKAENDRRGS